MEFTLFTLLNGISYGLLLFMLSSGLTLIFSRAFVNKELLLPSVVR
jgi:branched-subunit amino acid ABC-type transport system permease component